MYLYIYTYIVYVMMVGVTRCKLYRTYKKPCIFCVIILFNDK